MDSASFQRIERAFSGSDCSSSRPILLRAPLRRLRSSPSDVTYVVAALSRSSSGATLDAPVDSIGDVDAIETEAELITREHFPDSLNTEYSAQVASLQTLERLKGDLHSALLDLDEPDTEDGFSVDDWHKLNAARRQYKLEKAELGREEAEERDRRKKERALKRAARKAAQAEAAALGNTNSTSTVVASSLVPARRADSLPSIGARANARSRTRVSARWGRTAQPEPDKAPKARRPYSPEVSVKNAALDALNSISAHELLTGAEEVELSKKVQDFIVLEKAFNQLSEELQRKPTLSEWAQQFQQKEHDFIQRMEAGSAARTRMLTCNQRLVVSIARKYQNKGMEMLDLIQEGMVGLLRGVEKFDHTKGFKFSTYATWWIRQSISRSITELSRMIRLPAHLNEMLSKMNRLDREFTLQHMRSPTEEEMAGMLGIPVARVRTIKQASCAPRSLDDSLTKQTAGEKDATTVGETIEDTSTDDMESHVVNSSMRRDVNAVLNTLTPREHGIIRMRYGLDDGQPRTLEEIGTTFHVTRERIRQIENKALANLKNPSRNNTLHTYVDGEADSLVASVGWKTGIQRDSSF